MAPPDLVELERRFERHSLGSLFGVLPSVYVVRSRKTEAMNISMHLMWWNAWRDHIQNAKANPDRAHGYCQAAVIAQAEFVMYQALYWAKVHP